MFSVAVKADGGARSSSQQSRRIHTEGEGHVYKVSGRNPSEETKSSAATRGAPVFDRLWLDIRPRIGRCWRTQPLAAEEERGTPVGVRQESEMADLDEAGWQEGKPEPADELDRVERPELWWVPVGRVSPAQGHWAILPLDQAAVGDGPPVRIASQILEDLLGTGQGRLGIDHPVQSLELSEESIEGSRLLASREHAAKPELVSAIGAAEQRQELAPKQLGEDFAGPQESRTARADPTGVIRGDAAGGNEAVQMRMRTQLLIPGVQHRQESDLGSDSARIGCPGE